MVGLPQLCHVWLYAAARAFLKAQLGTRSPRHTSTHFHRLKFNVEKALQRKLLVYQYQMKQCLLRWLALKALLSLPLCNVLGQAGLLLWLPQLLYSQVSGTYLPSSSRM